MQRERQQRLRLEIFDGKTDHSTFAYHGGMGDISGVALAVECNKCDKKKLQKEK